MTVDRSVIRELEAIVGAEHVRTDPGDVEPYSRDATPAFRAVPDAVVWPRTAEEVAAILKLATARRVPVIPRGAGSNLAAATVAERGGVVMVLTRMDKILEVSSAELLARVETGVSTAALADAAAAKGLLYAPGPGQPHRLDRRRQRRHVRGRAARAQVRRHPQLRAGHHGRPAHRRDHQDRWAAVEGRGGLRPHPAAHRVGGHARGAHRGDRRAAAHARHQQHRRRVLPDAGRRGPGRRRDHRPRDRARPRWSSSTPSASGPSRSTPTSGCATTPDRCCCSATTGRRTSSTATWTASASSARRPARSR